MLSAKTEALPLSFCSKAALALARQLMDLMHDRQSARAIPCDAQWYGRCPSHRFHQWRQNPLREYSGAMAVIGDFCLLNDPDFL